MSERNIGDYLGFEYEYIPEEVTAENLMQYYLDELEKGRQKGYIPVIIPTEDRLEDYLEDMQNGGYDGESLPDTAEFFAAREKDYEDEIEESDFHSIELTDGDKNESLVSMLDYESGELAECVIVHLPTDKPWEVPLLVPFGGWNECPDNAEMAAVLKKWYDKYGAVPAAITHDTLELVLPKAVPRDEAPTLAREHFLFCPDRVDQCTESGTIGELAGDLSVSTVWYFWWD